MLVARLKPEVTVPQKLEAVWGALDVPGYFAQRRAQDDTSIVFWGW